LVYLKNPPTHYTGIKSVTITVYTIPYSQANLALILLNLL